MEQPARLARETELKERIGVTADILRNAVEQGEISRRTCTELDPPVRAGFTAWAHTVRVLREQLVPSGWLAVQWDCLPTIRPDREVAIVVQTGDEFTGSPDNEPRSSHSKGPAVRAAVARNRQGILWRDIDQPKNPPPRETWVLLIHRAEAEVRYELSLPTSVDEDGRIAGWRERLLFEAISLEPDGQAQPPDDTGEIDIPIRKKRG